jgi:hypothetical protein
MWRVKHTQKRGGELIPASALIENDDGHFITMQSSEATTKAEVRELAEEMCEGMNWSSGAIREVSPKTTRYHKGRPVITLEQSRNMPCPFPPEPDL